MISINKTVGTPGNMSICAGKAIFLINGSDVTLPLGYQTHYTPYSDENVNIGGEFFAGVCGPAWALKMEIKGEATGNRLVLEPVTYDSAAGTLCGVALSSFAFHCHYSAFFVEFDFTLSILEIDILELLIKAYELATGKKLLPEVTPSSFVHKTYGVNDSGSGTLGSNLTITRKPAFVLEWDLWMSILSTTAPYALPEWNEVKWVFDMSFGPEFKITLNVPLKLTKVAVGSIEYTGLTYDTATSKISGTTANPAMPSATDVVRVTFHDVPSISFGVGIFFEFKVIQIFSVRFDLIFTILENLGYSLIGEFDQTVDSTSFGAPCLPCFGGLAGADSYEVEFV